MTSAAPKRGWRAVPRRSVTAMKLVWRALRKLRGVPPYIATAYHASFKPVWHPRAERWRLAFRPTIFARKMGEGLARLGRRGPILYRTADRGPRGVPKPRILHAIPNVFVGGSTQLIFDICDACGNDFEMRILTSAMPRGAAYGGIRIDVVSHPAEPEAVARVLQDTAPHLLHLHYWGAADEPWYQVVLSQAAAAGIPVIVNVNTPVAPPLSSAIAETVFVSNYVRETFGPAQAPADVIYPGIDLARFAMPDSYDAHAARSLGMIYRLEPDKLRADAIDPLIDVCKKRPDVRVVVVGEGSLFKGYVARTKAEGVRAQFFFAGAVPYETLSDYYRLFRIFVCPVWQESFGQVTPFAMCMGNAVAGNRIGAISEILESGETLGENATDTVNRILQLLADPIKIEALGRRNRAMALERFDVRTMTDAYDALYRRLLGTQVDQMAGFPPSEIFV